MADSEADIIYAEDDSVVIMESEPIVHVISSVEEVVEQIVPDVESSIVYVNDAILVTEVEVAAEVISAEEEAVVIESIEIGPQGIKGDKGDSGLVTRKTFSYGDATPVIIATMEAGSVVHAVDLSIVTAFDGVGAVLSIGTLADHDLLMGIDQNDPAMEGVYCSSPAYKFNVETVVYLFITPGAGANVGDGMIVISF